MDTSLRYWTVVLATSALARLRKYLYSLQTESNQFSNWASMCLRRPLEQKWVCALVVLSAHMWSLSSQFVDFDDPVIFLDRQDLQIPFLELVLKVFDLSRPDTWRPIRDLSHWIDFTIHSHTPVLSHLHNLGLLGLIVVFFCKLADRLGFEQKWSYLAIILAFVHPVQVETIAWISGRKDLLAALFMVLSLVSFERMLQAQNKTFHFCLTLLTFGLGVLSKGHLVVMPCLYLCIWKIKTSGQLNEHLKQVSYPLITVLLTSILGLLLASRIAGGGISLTAELSQSERYGITLLDKVQLPLRYIGHLVWPVELNHVYLTRIPSPFQYGLALGSVVLVSILFYWTVKLWFRGSKSGPLLLCFMSLMLPYMHVKTGVVYMADRYLFCALPFLFLGLMHQISDLACLRLIPKRVSRFTPWTVFGLYFVLCIGPHTAFSNSINLWSRMADVYPQSAWGLNRLAHALYRENEMEEATAAWLKAASLRPDDPQYLNNAAVAAMATGHIDLARDIILKANSRHPDDPFVKKNIINIRNLETLNQIPNHYKITPIPSNSSEHEH